MEWEAIERYARDKGLSRKDAAQTFLQVIVLKHLSLPQAALMGGTALVLGHGNPRFSEDIDLTQVRNPSLLKRGLERAASEIEKWLGEPVKLTPLKTTTHTWRLTCPLERLQSVRLHVDSQRYPAETMQPIVIQFPSLPGFICNTVGVDEIMADKMLALAFRKYLGGRDLFDLWFHWLRLDDWRERLDLIRGITERKLKIRKFKRVEFLHRLGERLLPVGPLERARQEWRRYLPPDFQKPGLEEEIIRASRRLPEVFER